MGAAVLVDLSRDRLRSRRFADGEMLHEIDGFVKREWDVEADIGLHLRQTDDSGAGDDREKFEEAVGVLGPSL
nr:unnamed protein product [Spirometra erinaceieuropaei]